MSDQLYVVEKDTNSMGHKTIVYVGDNATEAADIAEDLYVPRTEPSGPLETFISVWENGEHQFTTRKREVVVTNE